MLAIIIVVLVTSSKAVKTSGNNKDSLDDSSYDLKEQRSSSPEAVKPQGQSNCSLDDSSYFSPKRGTKRGLPSSPVSFSACVQKLEQSPPKKLGPVASPPAKLGPVGNRLLQFLFSSPSKPSPSKPSPTLGQTLAADYEDSKKTNEPGQSSSPSKPSPTLGQTLAADYEDLQALGRVVSPPPQASPTLSDMVASNSMDDRVIAWMASADGPVCTMEYEPDHLDDCIDGISKRDLRQLMSWDTEDLTEEQFKYWAQYCTL